MDSLNQLQSPPPYKPLTDASAKAPGTSRKSWRGRKVSAEDRLLDAVRGPAETTVDQLKSRLQQRYGRAIEQKVAGKLPPNTPLAERRVAALEKKARKLLGEYQSANRKHLKSWIKDETSAGLVARQFELVTGYRWDTIPAHERRYMVDQVRLVLAQSQEKLTQKQAAYLAGQYLQQHQSMFTRFCPETAGLLQELTDLKPPIIGGHLLVWAAAERDSVESDGDTGGLSKNDLQVIQNFHYLNNKVMAIVSSSSLEDTEAASYHEQIEAVKKLNLMLMQCMEDVEDFTEKLPLELCNAMIHDLERSLDATNDYKRQLQVNAEGDPRRAEQWQKLRLTELKAARQLVTDELGMYGELEKITDLSPKDRRRVGTMGEVLGELEGKITAIESGTDKTKFPKEETRRYQKHIENFLRNAGFSQSEASERMRHYRTQQLINMKWEPIVKKMVVQLDGKMHECESLITPAACLKLDLHERPEGKYDVFPVQYEGTGRPSSNPTEARHAVNLNETRLQVDGHEEFRGLRSATLSSYRIKDDSERWAANVARAKELVVAAVRMQITSSAENRKAAAAGEKIPVKLFSTSLLSPDRARHITHIHDDELTMQQEQVQALNYVVRKIQEEDCIAVTESNGDPCEVEVDLDLITCNFGVNNVSLNPVQRRLMGAWGACEAENREALQKLVGSTEPGEAIGGWVSEYLDKEQLSEEEQIVIVELVEQIRQMYTSESYKEEGQDAYDMVERLQYLAYRIKAVPHINCKSGKDRTGEADAAIKRFVTQVSVNGYVPDPDLPMSREEQILVQQFALGSGSIELQQQNLNKPGYKTQVGKSALGDYAYRVTHEPDFDSTVNLHRTDYLDAGEDYSPLHEEGGYLDEDEE